jgi:hypothetical protein
MKLALLIGLDAEKRSGRPLTAGLVPFDQALTAFKGMVSARKGPAHHVQLWTAGGITKTAKFDQVEACAMEAAPLLPAEIPDDLKKLKKEELVQHLAAAVARIAELERHLGELSNPHQQEQPRAELDLAADDSPPP